MPKPGSTAVAKLAVELHDTVWDVLYVPLIRLVDATTERMNALQFLTIRKYLMLVFGALITLLIIVGTWR